MEIFTFFKNLLFPPKCASCLTIMENRTVFCPSCMPEIPFIEGITCEKCGIALSSEFPSSICSRCRDRGFSFERNIPLMEHSGLGRKAVINMKYKSAPVIKDMALMLAGRIAQEDVAFDAVTFIPMTEKDERTAKMHITYFLSKELAKLLKIRHEDLLIKLRDTKKQKELTEKERILNVRGAYGVRGDVKGKNILLVDDVFTTGATMGECAKILKRAGAEKVYCATVSIRDRE